MGHAVVEQKTGIPGNSYYNDRPRCASQNKLFGVRPYFYRAEDVAKVDKLLYIHKIACKVNLETLHSCIPPIYIPPLTEPTRPADEYGFTRLNAFSSLVRSNLRNVKTCHAIVEDSNTPFGNLSYLANPLWSCFGIFKSGDELAEFADGQRIISFHNEDLDKLPNLIATVNCLMGYNANGEPSIMLSRVYGEQADPQILVRLTEYFKYRWGLNVYVHNKWAREYGNVPAEQHVYGKLFDKDKLSSIISPPVEPQIYVKSGSEWDTPSRYADIAHPCILWPNKQDARDLGVPLLIEHHECFFWQSQKDLKGAGILGKINKAHRKELITDAKRFVSSTGTMPQPSFVYTCSRCDFPLSVSDNPEFNPLVGLTCPFGDCPK